MDKKFSGASRLTNGTLGYSYSGTLQGEQQYV